MKSWKRIRSLLAIALSAAMIVTTVPMTTFSSIAAEATTDVTMEDVSAPDVTAPDAEGTSSVSNGDVTAPDVSDSDATKEPVEDAPIVSGGDVSAPDVTAPDAGKEPVENAPTVSGGDVSAPDVTAPDAGKEPVENVPTVSDGNVPAVSAGDLNAQIQEYQGKKLRIKTKQTTIFTGQNDVIAAQIGYEKTTKDEGYGYVVTDVRYSGLDASSVFNFDTSNPEELKVSVSSYNAPTGKYVVTLLPVVPEGIYAQAVNLTINVVQSIFDIELTGPEKVYKESGKAASFQVSASLNYGTSVYKPYKPGAIKWSVEYYDADEEAFVPYEGKDITISSTGKVTLGKKLDTEKYSRLSITCQANDYEGNATKDSYEVEIISSISVTGTAVIASVSTCKFLNGSDVTAAALNYKYLRVVTDDNIAPGSALNADNTLKSTLFTYKSSSKDVTIDSEGRICVLNVSGKPVTLTATALDGKTKKSIKLNLKKAAYAMDDLKVNVSFMNDGSSATITKDTPDYTYQYEGIGNDAMQVTFWINGDIDCLDHKVTIKGGKDITSSYRKFLNNYAKIEGEVISATEKQSLIIVPTSQVVEVTVKSGDESRTFKMVNTKFSNKKNTVGKGEPKLTTGATLYKINDTQTIKIYAGKQNAKGTVTLGTDAAFGFGSVGNAVSYQICSDIIRSAEIDDDGYATFTLSYVKERCAILDAQAKNVAKIPASIKLRMTVADQDGNQYAPSTFTVKITNSAPKTDYKLRTSYKITKQQEQLKLFYADWAGEDDDKWGYEIGTDTHRYYYYQKLTYSGSKVPQDSIAFVDFEVDLGKDLLSGSDLAKKLDICKDDAGNYYVAVNDRHAHDILRAANEKVLAAGRDVAKYGKDGKLEGNLYITYNITTKEGYVIQKTDKVKVSIVISKSDWARLNIK